MHVLCFGAGAIGSLVGARLALAGTDVTLLARRDHVAAIRTWGLVLETPRERLTCKRIDSITALDDLAAPPDLVLLTTKAYHTREAMTALRGALPDRAVVMSLQNGVGNEELIAADVGPARTLAGAVTINASRPRPGVVRQHSETGGIAMAPMPPGLEPHDVAALFRRSGLPTDVQQDYRAMKWSKLLLNLFTNASSAILDLPPLAIVDDRRLYGMEREGFLEARRVMRALGLRPVALPGYPIPLLQLAVAAPPGVVQPMLRRFIRRGRGDRRPSLWHDLQRGRAESEVDVLNGAVVREGARLDVRTPVNNALTEVLLGLVGGRLDPRAFRGHPEALLAYVDSARARGSSAG
ncbi:MAG TPA: ketopantoate reductase family protein [bacterium]|nr:ketopantoate reductase family protein [bacterium]